MLATCSPFILINRQDESTTAESSDVLMNGLIQWVEINDELTKICGREIKTEWKHLFSQAPEVIEGTKLTQHINHTGNHPPIRQYPRRLPFSKQDELDKMLK